MRRLLARFRRDARAAVAIIGGVAVMTALAAAAVAVDAGGVYVARRVAQSATDLAAMAAARDLANPEAAARAALADNGVTEVDALTVTLGRYEADPAVAPEARFTANATPANAARVELASRAALHFGRMIMDSASVPMRTRATASSTALASFSIGSRLASLDGGVANALLTGLLGGNVALSVMDYDALADLDVDLLSFADALATELDVTAGTYEDLLDLQADVGDIVNAMASVARGAGAATAEAALLKLGNQSHAAQVGLDLAALMDLGPYAHLGIGESVAAAAARVGAYDLLRASAELANAHRQVDVGLGLAVPGLLSVNLRVAVGERPQGTSWIAVGREGATVYTAQTRVRLIAEVGGSGLLLGARIRVPLYVDVAAARATLTGISCGLDPERDARVTLSARPGVAALWIGEPASAADFWGFAAPVAMNRATLVSVPLLATVTALSHAAVTNLADDTLVFTMADIRAGTPQNIRTRDFTDSLLPRLIQNLNLNVTLLGLPLGGLLQAVANLVTALVAPLAATLDPVLNSLLKLLGVGLGEADVWTRGVRCDGAALVG